MLHSELYTDTNFSRSHRHYLTRKREREIQKGSRRSVPGVHPVKLLTISPEISAKLRGIDPVIAADALTPDTLTPQT